MDHGLQLRHRGRGVGRQHSAQRRRRGDSRVRRERRPDHHGALRRRSPKQDARLVQPAVRDRARMRRAVAGDLPDRYAGKLHGIAITDRVAQRLTGRISLRQPVSFAQRIAPAVTVAGAFAFAAAIADTGGHSHTEGDVDVRDGRGQPVGKRRPPKAASPGRHRPSGVYISRPAFFLDLGGAMEHKETNFVRDESSGAVREESTVVNETGATPMREASIVKSSTPARRAMEVIYLFFGVIDALLLIRLVLKLLGANPHAGFASFTYGLVAIGLVRLVAVTLSRSVMVSQHSRSEGLKPHTD